MHPIIALVICAIFIVFLFIRDHKNHPDLSHNLWIPIVWLFFASSRNFSAWLNLGANQVKSLEAYAEGNPIDRYFLLVLIILAFYIVYRRKLSWIAFIQENKLVFFFIMYCLISIIWSDFPFIAFKRLVKFIGMLPIIVIVISENSPASAIAAVIRRCSYLLVTFSVLFIRYFPDYGRYYNTWSYQVGYSGVGSTKNELGVICLVAGVYFLWEILLILKQHKYSLTSLDFCFFIILLSMTFYLLKIANSSTANMCLIVGGLVILVSGFPSLRDKPKTLGLKILGIAALMASSQLIFNVKDLIISALGRSPTLTGRTDLWNILLNMNTNPIIGTGYESFWTTNRLAYIWSLGIDALQAHNGYIDTYLNLGLIGVLFFIGLLVRSFKIISNEITFDYDINRLKLSFLIIYVLFNYSEAAFPRPVMLFILFFLFTIRLPQPKLNSQLG